MNKLIHIIKCLTDPALYRELARYFEVFYYEHARPLASAKQGKDTRVHPTVSIRFGENIQLGNHVAIGPNCGLWASKGSRIVIGDNSGVAFGTLIVSSNHTFLGDENFREQELMERDVVIGNDVWIGANCVILYGVSIGHNSIVGAGSVISRNIPENTVVAGKSRELTELKRLGF